jgi:hypothetical protein
MCNTPVYSFAFPFLVFRKREDTRLTSEFVICLLTQMRLDLLMQLCAVLYSVCITHFFGSRAIFLRSI